MVTVEEFIKEARVFLDGSAELKKEAAAFQWGVGPDDLPGFGQFSRTPDSPETLEGKRWAARRFDAGFGWIDGPIELGGRGLTSDHAKAYDQLEARYQLPDMGLLSIAVGFIAPTILAHGTPQIRQKFLPAMYRGDLIVCQLFSEPNAGSDLAAARTTAVRDGDEWVVNGQKVWTSNAQCADIGLAVTRTDREAPKHRGITMFLVDMHSPGVEVRPLRQMNGSAGFNEVFLTDVRVPDAQRIGAINDGFNVIITTLGNERSLQMRSGGAGSVSASFERLLAVAEHYADRNDPLVRQHLATLCTLEKLTEYMVGQMVAKLENGEALGADAMILKLLGATHHTDAVVDFLSDVLGPRLAADSGEWGTYSWSKYVLGIHGGRIGGGTDEIILNRLGETVLGLPKEPRPDKPITAVTR
jgi:alkylation response protein AidB-like acyl-CoA dehydrogenase